MCATLSGTAAAAADAVVTAVAVVAAATSYLCTHTAIISNIIQMIRAASAPFVHTQIFSACFILSQRMSE